jgi:hypothetical protein
MAAAATAVQRKAIGAAALEAVLTVTAVRLCLSRLRRAAGNEGRKLIDIAACLPAIRDWWLRLLLLRLMLLRLMLLMRASTVGLLVTIVVEALLTRNVRLRLTRRIGLLRLSLLRLTRRIAAIARAHPGLIRALVVVSVLIGGVAALLLLVALIVGILLTELLLHRGDQAKIMLGVLEVVLGRHRIAGRLRVACELHVLVRYVRSGAADFHVGPVRLVDPSHRVLALAAVAASHAFVVLTVSHGMNFSRPPIGGEAISPGCVVSFRPRSTLRCLARRAR